MRLAQLATLVSLPLTLTALPAAAQAHPLLARQVFAAESSFAATMANRDLEEFGRFVATDAVFFGEQPLRGRQAVSAGWREYFSGTQRTLLLAA